SPDKVIDPQLFSGNSARSTPAAGDGGLIGFGSNMLTDYNLLDPRDGSLIDNADIRYLTRIELQGGGISDLFNLNGDTALDDKDASRNQKLGIPPATQNNAAVAMTISNSNLSDFSQVGVIAHPGPNAGMLYRDMNGVTAAGLLGVARLGFPGQPPDLYMVN